MLGVLAESATSAVGKFEKFEIAYIDSRPVQPAERWTDGTAPDKDDGPAMSEPDTGIVRRIRARCPDTRYDGGSDTELIELFRRNKRVLNRSDEDVIAAMTHPR